MKSSTVETVGDFSPDMLAFNESMLEPKPSNASVPSMVRHVTDAIVRVYKKDERYIHKEFHHFKRPPVGDGIKPREPREGKPRQRSYGFKWVIEEYPKLKTWGELFEEYLAYKKVQRADAVITNLNRWLYYLLTLKNPPLCPEEVNRAVHIRNVANTTVNTYWAYVTELGIGDRTKCNALSHIRRFFDYYQDKLIAEYRGRPTQAPVFTNPVKEDDRWQLDYQRRTHRYAFGSELLDFLREILLDRDESGKPTLNWAKNHPSMGNDWTTECDVKNKETVHVWWPGRAIVLYVLLTVPVRAYQARWLDEGIGDEFIYDFSRQEMIRNPHPLAENGRRESVFRMMRDPFHDTSFLGIYVDTNKTKVYDPTVVRGYEIPWPNEEFFSVLQIMQEWNRRFFPNPQPVTFADDSAIIISEGVKPYLPKFYPLFRDKTSFGGRSPDLPPTTGKIRELWNRLLAEAEKRLKEHGKEVHLVDWVPDKKSNNSKQLVPRARFDLHSLRVSGITSLIEKGIPVHIVSEYIAGHATIVMTLYYEKTHPAKVREILLRAQDNAKADLDGCLALIDHLDDPASVLVWNNFDYHHNDALSALNSNKGLWTVELDGICPGTICEEGGPPDASGDPTAVPTGACGLCRYYITGPAFLYGQMQKLNNLMYSMREKGEVLKELRLKEIDLEDGDNRRILTETRGRRERIERELKDIMREWHNRYRMYQTSLSMLDAYERQKKREKDAMSKKGGESLMPLLTPNSEEGFKPIAKEATNLGLVRQITLMNEILGNFDLRKGPIKEYEEILNTILMNNGFEAFLLTVSKEKRVAAANMLGEFLINSIGEAEVERLYNGEVELSVVMKRQAQGLLDYIKSDTPIAPPSSSKRGGTTTRLIQIKGLASSGKRDGLKAGVKPRKQLAR